jgi:hypothetical protein
MRTTFASLPALALLATFATADDKEAKRKPKFTIGKETTYVSGPVDEDGYIDYAAALNERLGKGIKPNDNANVLLWKAFGPNPGGTIPPDFFKWLGVPAPPERGDYFIDWWEFSHQQRKLRPGEEPEPQEVLLEKLERATKWPWTAKESPDLAAWLKANEKPLALVVEASKRRHYFLPLVLKKSKKSASALMSVNLPGLQHCREFAMALNARAMLRVGEGRDDEAWQDLLACHRLGRLIGRGGTLIEGLVGLAIDSVASKADLAFLDGAKLTTKQMKECLRDLQTLPPLPDMAAKLDLHDRFMFLDAVVVADRDGIEALKDLGTGPKATDPQAKRLREGVDWETVLRRGNRWYDRIVTAMRVRDQAERDKQLANLEEELRKLKKNLGGVGAVAKILLAKNTAKARGEEIGNVLISMMVPSVRKIQQARDRIEQVQGNVHLAFALACYQRENGRYPMKLEALAPKYLTKVPGDLFSGKALVYRPTEKGYLLYSVGANGEDDEGRGSQDDPPGDDLAVRMPLPKLPRK